MTSLTLDQLRAIAVHTAAGKLARFVDPLNAAFEEFEINTRARCEAFLAQVAHESGGFLYMAEIASGSKYEGRADLGNTEPGDGPRFKGRGPIQITGRKNYGLCAAALELPLLEHPECLEQPENGCRAAGWFWTIGAGLSLSKRAIAHGVPLGVNLNDLADAGDFEGITLAINGGLNGFDERKAYLAHAQAVLEEVA